MTDRGHWSILCDSGSEVRTSLPNVAVRCDSHVPPWQRHRVTALYLGTLRVPMTIRPLFDQSRSLFDQRVGT